MVEKTPNSQTNTDADGDAAMSDATKQLDTVDKSKKGSGAKGKKQEEVQEMSDEDKALKERLDELVATLTETKDKLREAALEQLKTEIRSATASMTSVPKPLKFLRPHYENLKALFSAGIEAENRALFADILSVLGTTMGKEGSLDCLRYRLEGTGSGAGWWGHSYVRTLSMEVGIAFQRTDEDAKALQPKLMALVDDIAPYHFAHNAEHEGCDLLMEVDRTKDIAGYADENNYSRICLYLVSCAQYVPEPEDSDILRVALAIYRSLKKFPDALRIALRLGSRALVLEIFEECDDPLVKKQLGFMLGRQHMYLDTPDDDLNEIIYNTRLSEHFASVARELDVYEAKNPEDVYKDDASSVARRSMNSARANLAASIVNAFVNAGYGHDKMVTNESTFIFKNKDHAMLTATASLGMVMLWDVDGGLPALDKHLYSSDTNIKAGAVLGIGMLNSGVFNDCDPAFALLSEYVNDDAATVRRSAILGLGLAYAGSEREDILELLMPILADGETPVDLFSFCALALGMIFTGTCHSGVAEAIIGGLIERPESEVNDTIARFASLGLGLLFLSRQEECDATLEALSAVGEGSSMSKYCALTVETCAYAATGNVLKVQKLLHICGEHEDENSEESAGNEEGEAPPATNAQNSATSSAANGASGSGANASSSNSESGAQSKEQKSVYERAYQSLAVLGVSLVAMGEELGSEMSLRTFDHLMQYGDDAVKRAVPLSLALLNISSPAYAVADTLGKITHDADLDVARSAILGLGLIGAGTNNARIAGMLRQLATFYSREANTLFVVRTAQGLLYAGKSLLSMSQFSSDGLLMSRSGLAGLLVVLHAALDMPGTILADHHYLLFSLVLSMNPRFLVTLDEEGKTVNVPLRVGQAVDVVGQAGRPKTITGFQTHDSPVLLKVGERAELATDEYEAQTSVLEGFVVLRKVANDATSGGADGDAPAAAAKTDGAGGDEAKPSA